MSDDNGTALMLDCLPKARVMLADKGYDVDWFRQAFALRGIAACIPARAKRKAPVAHDAVL